MNNREIITDAVLAYIKNLPVPKELPKDIFIEIRFEKATEKHHISLGEGEAKAQTKKALATELVDRYNEICVKLPKVQLVTDKRISTAASRLKVYGMDKLCEVFRLATESDFLCGGNDRGWKADFDWLTNENNIAKVLEGKFSNAAKVTRAGTRVATSFDVNDAVKKAMERAYAK